MSNSGLEDAREGDLREADLIDRWLDEGDKLSENARMTAAGAAAEKRRRLGEVLGELRAMADRRRFAFVIGLCVVSAIAIVAMRAASHAVLRTDPGAVTEQAAVLGPPPPAPTPPPIAPPPAPAAAAMPAPEPAPAPPPAAAAPAAPAPEPAPAPSPAAAAPPPPEPAPAPASSPTLAPAPSPVAAATPAPPPTPPAPAPVQAAVIPSTEPVPAGATAPTPKKAATAALEPTPTVATRAASATALPAAAARSATAAPAASPGNALQECQTALRRERAKPALAACEKVARDQPASADALVLLAHAQLLGGWEGETLRLAHRAAFLDPKCADAYLLIGTVQQSAGRTAEARSAYQDYLHLAPHGSHAAEIRAILKTL